MPEIFVGLGSNLGDPEQNLRHAVKELSGSVRVEAASSIYRTEPVGLREQPHFLNAVLRAETELEPWDVLERLVALERAMGRQRHLPLGPRTIDLDLLLYGDRVIEEPGLVVPHPRMSGRRFVLEPLAELAPELRPLRAGPTVRELLAALPRRESVHRVQIPGWPPEPLA